MPGENDGQEIEVQTQGEQQPENQGGEQGDQGGEGGEQSNLEQAADALTDSGGNDELPTDKPQSTRIDSPIYCEL